MGALGASRWQPSETKIFQKPGAARAQPGTGLRTATRLSVLAGDHRDPGTETPTIGSKSPYCRNSGAAVRRREERERSRGGAGMPGRHPIGRLRKLPAGERTFGLYAEGGGARGKEWVSGRRREGVRRADRAHHWSVVVPGCEEMGGRGISCPRPLPPSPQTNKHSHSFFVQAIDDIGLTIQSIHRLKECVADPPEWESQQKDIPGRANQKR